MSFRNWFLNAALGGCLAASVATHSLAQSEDSKRGNNPNDESATVQKDEPATTHFAPGFRVDKSTYGAICDSPKDKDHADLCQQWRVAESTETALWLNGLSLLLLFGAFIAAVWAARAASAAAAAADKTVELSRAMVDEGAKATAAALDAAKEAKRQADLIEESHAALQRPYVFVFGAEVLVRDGSGDWFVKYTVANYGNIPAVIEVVCVGFVCSDNGQPPLPLTIGDDHTLATSPILQAGERRAHINEYLPTGYDTGGIVMSVSGEIIDVAGPDLNLDPTEDMFFRIVVSYRGPFTSGYQTSGLWLHERGGSRLMRRGGEEYNYNR